MIRNKLISLALVVVAVFTAQAMTVAAHDLQGSATSSVSAEHGLKLGHLTTDAKAALKAKHQVDVQDKDEKQAPKKKLDGACMSAAVDVRDTAVLNAFDAYSVSVKSALTARRTALKAAWLVADAEDREDAVVKAWVDFKASFGTAKRTLRDARNNAWTTFKASRKTCGGEKSDHNAEVRGRSGMSLDIQL